MEAIGHSLHPYGRHNRAMVLKMLDGQCGVAGYFCTISYVCRVKTMSFESTGGGGEPRADKN